MGCTQSTSPSLRGDSNVGNGKAPNDAKKLKGKKGKGSPNDAKKVEGSPNVEVVMPESPGAAELRNKSVFNEPPKSGLKTGSESQLLSIGGLSAAPIMSNMSSRSTAPSYEKDAAAMKQPSMEKSDPKATFFAFHEDDGMTLDRPKDNGPSVSKLLSRYGEASKGTTAMPPTILESPPSSPSKACAAEVTPENFETGQVARLRPRTVRS
eukprot:Trichotokara_eunicae@DN6048_c0_g1_i1.p1